MSAAPLRNVSASAFRIPTDAPEADGSFDWSGTTIVVVEIVAGDETGLGYTYASEAAAGVIENILAPVTLGEDALDIPRLWFAMTAAVRNQGRRGLCACAISAVDAALWDLKAKLLRVPLAKLLGAERDAVDVYGSGGFTSYDDARLMDQLRNWVERDGCRAVKMKIGAAPERDDERVRAARRSIGGGAQLYIDANGALTAKQALAFAERFAAEGVNWFEEPVPSDDLEGLHLLRIRSPAGMDIAAGEYGYDPLYFRRMLEAGAVDVLQADATRCGGVTGFLRAAALADAYMLPLSAHTAPALHLHVCCAAPRLKNIEWFHDHARIEAMLFDGAPTIGNGAICPDLSRPGMGLIFKSQDAVRYRL